MKKTIVRIIGVAFLAGLIALCLNKQGESSIETSVKELEPYFTRKADEFSGTIWIEPKTKPKYTDQNGYCLYFEEFDGVACNPRFLIQYEADEWLFIQKMIFNADGQIIEFTPKEMQEYGNGAMNQQLILNT